MANHGLYRMIGLTLMLSASPLISAQMAAIQLTNPAVDTINSKTPAAWIADENMGILYCELITTDRELGKRVDCFDSNGPVQAMQGKSGG